MEHIKINEYQGFRLGAAGASSGKGGSIPVERVEDLDPPTFWAKYVSQRKPVLIQGHLTDAGWTASAKWDLPYLAEVAGAAKLKVEQRDGAGGSYGHGRKVRMRFRDFLGKVAQGDDTLYLTTQKCKVAPDGHPALWGEPLAHGLHQDLEACPPLMGRLVPQQINLWMGVARDGSSSGLHHDFHDNLYILLRGKKRFRLWDPSQAGRMPVAGKLVRVHPNGRVVYQGQGEVLADGSSAKEAAAWAARTAAERRVAAAEAALAVGEPGAAAAKAAADEALEAVLEAQLEGALQGAGGSDEEGDMDLDALVDDYMDEDGDADLDTEEQSAEDSEEEEEEGPKGKGGVRRGLGEAKAKASKKPRAAAAGKGKKEERDSGSGSEEDEGTYPPSFCPGVDLSQPEAKLRAQWPSLPSMSAGAEVVVEEGQMLYLPAGWFHEVTSFSSDTGTAAGAKKGKKGKHDKGGAASCHMALNYWFHPPDNLDPSYSTGFQRPYVSGYWPALWRVRAQSLGLPTPPEPPPLTKAAARKARRASLDGGPLDLGLGLRHHGAAGNGPSFGGPSVGSSDSLEGGSEEFEDDEEVDRQVDMHLLGAKPVSWPTAEAAVAGLKDVHAAHHPHSHSPSPRPGGGGATAAAKKGGNKAAKCGEAGAAAAAEAKGCGAFAGVAADEAAGAAGKTVLQRPFGDVHVDEAEGGTGHAPSGYHHPSFKGVHVDETEGGTGHHPSADGKPASFQAPHYWDHHSHPFKGVHADEKDGGTGHHPVGPGQGSGPGGSSFEAPHYWKHHAHKHHPFEGVHVDEAEGGTGHQPTAAGMVGQQPAAAEGGRRSRKAAAPKRVGPEGLSDPAGGGAELCAAKGASGAGSAAGQGKHGAGAAAGPAGSAEGAQEGAAQKRQKKASRAPEAEEGEEEGEEGDMGEMVSRELMNYFQSPEGAGAFKLALGRYLMEAMAREGAMGGSKKQAKPLRARGRRHRRVVRTRAAGKPQGQAGEEGENGQ